MTGVTTVVEVATTCFKSRGNCRMKIPSPPALIRGDDVFKKDDEYSCHSKVLWDDLKMSVKMILSQLEEINMTSIQVIFNTMHLYARQLLTLSALKLVRINLLLLDICCIN